ncbi:MAG: hypothetical protein Q9166_003195 [cf. Caloplaca sp. 2 TL-2023]
MPVSKGGPKKGQLGKKAQMEKMIEAAKKSPSKPANGQNRAVSKANGSKEDSHTVKTSPGRNQNHLFKPNGIANFLNQSPKAVGNSIVGQALEQSNGLRIGNGVVTLPDQFPKAAEIEAESALSLKEAKEGTATIRLPCQPIKFFPTKKTIPYKQPALLAIPAPKPFPNPNRVVVRFPAKETSKEPTTFLSLAQELRNQIYDYAMPRDKYRIEWIPQQGQRPSELTYSLPLRGEEKRPKLTAEAGKVRRDFDLPKRNHVAKAMPRYRLAPGPTALLLVSKQVNIDTAPMFYGRNTFSFTAMKPLGKFLDTLRSETRSMVRSLELIHFTASNAELVENQIWKHRHDQRWESLCFQIRNQCDHLEDLSLDLYVKDLPFKMGPHACWMSPLYAFMGLDHLKHVDVRLHQAEADEAVLEVEAYTVRKALMGDNFYEPIYNTGNKPLYIKPKPRKAHPGLNALRVTIGNRRVLASCIKPSLGPRATTFWSPPTPTYTDQGISYSRNGNVKSRRNKGKGKARMDSDLPAEDNDKAKRNEIEKAVPLLWNPPATLIGTAIKSDEKGKGKGIPKFGTGIGNNLKGYGKSVHYFDTEIKAVHSIRRVVKDTDKGKGKPAHDEGGPIKESYRKRRKAVQG